MGERNNDSELYSDIVPDSTTRDNILRKLVPTRSMDSIDGHPSSPSKPYSMASSSLAMTSTKTGSESARPAPRWAKSVTYGRKKGPLPEEQNDTEPESDAMDITDPPFHSTSRAAYTTPISKPRAKPLAASPSRASRSPSPRLGDGSDDDEDENIEVGNTSSASKYGYGSWKHELDAIDQDFDEQEAAEGANGQQAKSEYSQSSEADDAEMDTEHESPLGANPTRASNIHFTSSLSTLPSEDTSQSPAASTSKTYRSRRAVTTLESSSEADEDEDPLGLPTAANSSSHRPVKKRAVMDSDDEEESPERPSKVSRTSLAADTSRSSVSPGQGERMFESPLNKDDGSPPSSPPEDPDSTAVAPEATGGSSSKAKKGKRDSSSGKPKKLSKKEQYNMLIETEALKAQAPINVPIEEEEQPRIKVMDVLKLIAFPTAKSNKRHSEIASDPIVTSSQPAPTLAAAVTSSGAPFCPETPGFEPKSSANGRVLVLNSSTTSVDGSANPNRTLPMSDDVFLPGPEDHAKRENDRRAKEEAHKELQKKKLLWAKQQREAEEERKRKATAAMFAKDDDDDDDLEIELTAVDSQSQLEIVESQHGRFNTGEQLRKAVIHDRVHAASSPFKPSSASKAPKGFQHPRKSMPNDSSESFIEFMGKRDLLGVKAKPAIPKSKSSVAMIKRSSTTRGEDIRLQLLHAVRQNDAKVRQERDEEWEGRGGLAGRKQQIEQAAKLKQQGGQTSLQEWAKKGIEATEASEARAEFDYEEDEGDEEDEDYEPEEQEADAEMDGEEEQDENAPPKVERSRSSSVEPTTEDEDKENRVFEDKENVPPPHRQNRSALADKDDLFSPQRSSEAEGGSQGKKVAPPRRALEDAEDEVDDEDLFGLRPLKKHTARKIIADDDEDDDEDEDVAAPYQDENAPVRRSPVKFDAFDDDDDRPLRPEGLPFGGAGGKMLMFNSSAESLVDGAEEKKQTIGDGFEMNDADAEIEGDGFTQLFAMDSKPAAFDALRRREPLDDMDLESQKLLPVMDLSTQEMQKDDVIFEQDQLVRAAIEREERQKALQAQTKIYLDEDGFFTQTKPAATQMSIDIPADSHDFFAVPEVVEDDVLATQEQDVPLRRLRRGHLRQESEESLPSVEVTTKPEKKRDAFSVLMTSKPKEPKKKDKEKEKQMREFVQDQADESDEDKIFGFGGAKEDENEDDEENDKHLEGLVDDKDMDRSEVNEQAVIEKHQEQIAQDDAALEKYHLAATKGDYRGKKRDRGVGLDDDDSDDEDDGKRRMRLAMNRKRKVIGDQLDKLGDDARTLPFLQAYQQGITVDDDNEFGHDPSSEQPEPEEDPAEEDDEEEADDDEEEKEKDDQPTQRQVVTARQLNEEILAALDRGETSIDPNDIDWVDRELQNYEDDLDDDFGVKEIRGSRKAAYKVFGQAEVDEEARRETFRRTKLGDPKARPQARREEKGTAYGVSKAGTAITSHSSKSKASMSSTSSKAGGSNKPLAKTTSMLQARVPTKKGAFGS